MKGLPVGSVLEFDTSGTLLTAWGGPNGGTGWVANEHGLSVDTKNNVWVAGGGNGDTQWTWLHNASIIRAGLP